MKKWFILILAVICSFVSCQEPEPDPEISVTNGEVFSVSRFGDRVKLEIKTNQPEWSFDLGSASWITATKATSVLELNVCENDLTEIRTATITLTAKSSSGKVATASVLVNQDARIPDPDISLDCDNTLEVPAAASEFAIKVTTNQSAWTYEALNCEWIDFSLSGNTLNLSVKNNPSEDPRQTTIQFYAPDKDNYLVTKKLVVKQKELVIEYEPEVLSDGGTSNCYLITHRGQYSFDATVKGNGKSVSGLKAPESLKPAGAKLVWQTAKGMIDEVSLSDGVITFVANRVFGNALIAAVDEKGKIIWSWHIWFPRETAVDLVSASNDNIMSFNLGALSSDYNSVDCLGLLYQWGRKDPFPGSPVINNGDTSIKNVDVYDIDGHKVEITHVDAAGSAISGSHIDFSIANPTVCIGNRLQYTSGNRDWLPADESSNSLWGNPEGYQHSQGVYGNKGSKTYYDPCPKGYRTPSISVFSSFTKSGGIAWGSGDTMEGFIWGDLGGETTVNVVDFDGDGIYTLKDWTNGWHVYLDKPRKVVTFFPATTRYDGQYAMLMGSMVGLWANYWYNTPSEGGGGLSEAFSFGIKEYSGKDSITFSPLSSGSRADAYAVRCVKE